MKSLILILLFSIASLSSLRAQQQVNIVSTDCEGIEHNLYAELDSGVVVVLCWVMPCSDCIGPMISCSKVVSQLAEKYPNRVQLFILDDFGNTSCLSLGQWASTYGVFGSEFTHFFSDAGVKMTDFGTVGMPKIVALAGSSHYVIYSHENLLDSTALKTVMVNALESASEVSPQTDVCSFLTVYPNPTTNVVSIDGVDPDVATTVAMYTMDGRLVWTTRATASSSGRIELSLESLADDQYMIEAVTQRGRRVAKLCVHH